MHLTMSRPHTPAGLAHRSMSGKLLFCLAFFAFLATGCDDDSGINRQAFPELRADPSELIFPLVPVGQTTSRVLTLTNKGGARVRIDELSFSSALDGLEFTKEALDLPLVLAAGESVSLRVDYSPRDAGTDEGALVVFNSDDRGGELVVPIRTVESATQLIIDPDRLIYSAADAMPETREVRLQNLGNLPVSITNLSLAEGTSPDFTIVDPEARPVLAEGDEVFIGVTYTPRDPAGADGTLVIETDDEA